jgi:hypothetical protein
MWGYLLRESWECNRLEKFIFSKVEKHGTDLNNITKFSFFLVVNKVHLFKMSLC